MSSPINATWAANNVGYWRELGFDGFILAGISENIVPAGGAVGPPPTEDPNKPLLREVRLAIERLAEAGISHNFLHAGSVPGEACFVSADSATEAIGRTRAAARFCTAAGLKGIALDSASSSGFYDYRWDGYDYGSYEPDDLAGNARRFGRSQARAVLLELPGAEILVITDGWRFSGALWLPFFEGILEGAAMDDACRVHLLTRETIPERAAGALARSARETRAVLEHRLEPRQRALWRRQGGLSMGLAPLAWNTAAKTPTAVMDPQTFRSLVVAAKSLSDAFIWVESDGSCWWQLNPQEVETYSQLLQNGAAVPAQSRPVVDNLKAYSVRMPHDEWRLAGPLDGLGAPADVYATDQGAAIVFWSGTPGHVMLTAGDKKLEVKNLADDSPVETGAEPGRTVLPVSVAPLLVEGLPAWPWLIEAGLRVNVEQPPTPANPARISYAFRNSAGAERAREKGHPPQLPGGLPTGGEDYTGVVLRGMLTFLAPSGFGIKPESVPFDLAPGEEVRGEANLRGDFGFGNRVRLTAALAVAGGGVVTRALSVQAAPELAWSCGLDGNIAGNFLVAQLNETSPREVVACTAAGEVACIDAAGAFVWRRRFSESFAARPAAGVLATGEPAVAVIDTRGRLRLLNGAGVTAWEREAEPRLSAAVFADVDDFAGQEIVLGQRDGQVVALDAGGQELWRYKPLLEIAWLGAAPGLDGKSLLVAAQEKPMRMLAVLDRSGRLRWSGMLESALAGEPILADLTADGVPELIASTETGAITAWDLYTGEKTARVETGLAGATAVVAGGPGVLLSHRGGLNAYTSALEPAWSFDAPLAAPPAADAAIVIAPAGFGLVCLDAQGRELWQTDAGPPVAGAPLIADLSGDGTPDCIYADTARTLNALH